MHCNHFQPRPLSRREMLARCGAGFGGLALAGLVDDRAFADKPAAKSIDDDPLAVKPGTIRPGPRA